MTFTFRAVIRPELVFASAVKGPETVWFSRRHPEDPAPLWKDLLTPTPTPTALLWRPRQKENVLWIPCSGPGKDRGVQKRLGNATANFPSGFLPWLFSVFGIFI